MNCRVNVFRKIIIIPIAFAVIISCAGRKNDDLIKVLILSGKNNHEWEKTTPLLVKIYEESRLFTVDVTNMPDTLNYTEFKKYDVVFSNWNTWPDNDFRMPEEWESDFLRYVKEGGGVVFMHAGASSFYGWNEYHQMGIGRWGKETHHGKQTKGKIYAFDQTHPITKGLRDFYIVDEIWGKTDISPDAMALANVIAPDDNNGNVINEPVIFVNQIGEGRSFFTTLGHNERALLNSGLQTVLLRATQWTAGRNVTIEPPADLKEIIAPGTNSFSWSRSDTTFALINNSYIIWQYNFNNRFGKPYFHPVEVNNSILTSVSPPDHPWHLGLWFSWKFINGVNYWEYLNDFKSEKTGYKSAGITEIQKTNTFMNPDFSADIRMELQYHSADSDAVMTEKRDVHISSPLNDGSYFIDFEYLFSPLIDEIILDRTHIEGEPDGKSWGGYAGLNIRFNQDYTSPEIIVPTDSVDYKKNDWLYMGFNTLTGKTAGICILQNPEYTTPTSSWYLINDPEIPFFYYSPAVLYDGRIILKKGTDLQLKYRVWILPGKTGKEELQAKYYDYLNTISQQNQKKS